LRLRQFLVARQIEFRVAQIRLVLRLLRHRLIVRRLIRSGIDLGEHVARLHILPLAKPHGHERPIDDRLNAHRVPRLHGANTIHVHRNVGDHRVRDQHRHPGGILHLLRGIPRGFLIPAPRNEAADHRQRDHED
jgi:hypothetical protein